MKREASSMMARNHSPVLSCFQSICQTIYEILRGLRVSSLMLA